MNKNRKILSSKDISSKITRIAHEIIEHHNDLSNLVLLGIHNRGVPIAGRLRKLIQDFTDIEIQLGSLDITFHRDDFRERLLVPEVKGTNIPFSLDGRVVILIDDVLYSGRTTRAALDELNTFGRAARVQLAVLIDRGHRELPIKADYVGKNVPTNDGEHVRVMLDEVDNIDNVLLIRH